ncbi:MAG: HupE/UreJ family protein [Kofleriaceae bacterium]|nr:HupE/UreJ family protein [Kofleriaceae bacterium]MCB9572491.1 HupE/UreJ family protein [Kofleriaceae bacterium]
MTRRLRPRRGVAAAVAAIGAAWLALAVIAGGRAAAHDLRPGVLALVEVGPGDYAVRFVAPVDNLGESTDVTIVWPAGCVADRDGARLRCAEGLAGPLVVRGMHGRSMRTVVQVTRRDGARAEWIVGADAPSVDLGAPPPRAWRPWLALGVAHILGGLDHLAFVIGLLLVLDGVLDRRLLATISAFTAAHSLTLALAALGVVGVAAAPVEACIAASVLLVAREATHREPTVIRRWPWLAAAGFGLVHGLGFAGALGDLGLPRASLASSLVWFNLGVEVGQLAVVATVVLLVRLGRRLVAGHPAVGPRAHRVACYALGGVAAWWLLGRVVTIAVAGA